LGVEEFVAMSCRDFPDFYVKLYDLLRPEIFLVKYRARFFYLLDLFLTST
jgi:U3 small nucleolar RNA-associated protein 19